MTEENKTEKPVEEKAKSVEEKEKVKTEKQEEQKNQVVIDATNATLGRLASYTAKQALLGKKVAIVNCNEAIVLGNPESVTKAYMQKRRRGGSSLKGPFFPKSPEKIVKRTIRGMLPHRKGRGVQALKNIMCYNVLPAELEKSKKILAGKVKTSESITLQALSKLI
ncbi:50S ribosomal protein L13 [Candidatus Pacearchaeota archaeon]|jgi:large subunit ribosomal protein L13|nr:50S ribosomal protein L13 [Candidatus Pacearchaeota archaeon]|tara:strand:+ start:1735 stop:2232 length:498 start_codon:yes stop_codon:yes gene_type:complete